MRLSAERQRIDKWLWHARIVRTRSAAAGLAASGHVRVNGVRIEAPSKAVKPGDIVTIALAGGVRVLKVLGFVLRRGSAEAARALYADEIIPVKAEDRPVAQSNGVDRAAPGRPTKRERRAIDRFTGRGNP